MKKSPKMSEARYETSRLILRDWRDEDIPQFAQMNADPLVMEFFEKTFSLEETQQSVQRMRDCAKNYGYTFWAAEQKSDGQFIGCIGIFMSTYESPFTPGVEIGWRLDSPYWGQGYATEGARKALEIGFEKFALQEICAITVPVNRPSRRVMEKLGMSHNPQENFRHPKIPIEHRFSEHVLYRLPKNRWNKF